MTALHVGIDGAALLRPDTGIGRYTEELIRGLTRLEDAPRIEVLCNAFRGGTRTLLDDAGREGAPVRVVNLRIPHRLLRLLQSTLGWPTVETLLGEVDVFHASDWSHPPQRHGASVSTVHDVAPLLHPEWYDPDVAAHHRSRVELAVARADRIITVSEFTRRELLRMFDLPRERVRAVANGVSAFFRRPGDEEIENRLSGLGVASPYLLYVGTRERRKNLPGLVEIYARVRKERPDVRLVLAGMRPWDEARQVHGAEAWSGREVEERIAALGMAERVQVVGQVAVEDLRALYAGAAVFVFPTLYEGFGLPALEAMACGAPVVASDRTAVPEVVGGAGLTADPGDPAAFASAVLRVLDDGALARELRRRGLERAAEFGWDRTAAATAEVYRSAFEAVGRRA